MFKLKNIISKVKYHIIINKYEDLIYLKDDTVYINDIPILKGSNVFGFGAYGHTVYIGKNGMVHFKNYKDDYQIKFNKSAGVSFINENEALLYFGSDDYLKSYVARFDILNNVFKWKIEGIIGRGLIIKDYLFSGINNTNISKIDLNHPEKPLWQLDLNQLGTFKNHFGETQEHKVEKIIGVYNEHLYVALSGRLLLELDIKTGEITHRWEAPSVSSLSNGKLIAIVGSIYTCIDLKTKAFTKKDFSNELAKLDLVSVRSNNYQHTDTHIFAIANLDLNKLNLNWFKEAIIAFNYQTQQIDWHYTNDTFSTGTATPKIAANKLYQLDINGNLHIFEKQENEIV